MRRATAVLGLLLLVLFSLTGGAVSQISYWLDKQVAPSLETDVEWTPLPASASTWAIERVDAPKLFEGMGDRSLALDEPGSPRTSTQSPTVLLPADIQEGLPPPPAGLHRHRVVATIPLTPGIGMDPVAIAADPNRPLVYAASEGSGDIT